MELHTIHFQGGVCSEIENSCVYKLDGTLITRWLAQREVKIPIMSPLSTQGLIKLINAQTPKITKEIFWERYVEEGVANCGMTYSSKISYVYDFNGRVKHDHPSYGEEYNQRIWAGSDIFDVSNYMLKKQYGAYFLRPSTTAKA